jgi:hypothetical protein
VVIHYNCVQLHIKDTHLSRSHDNSDIPEDVRGESETNCIP